MAISPSLLPAVSVLYLLIIHKSTAMISQSSVIDGERHHHLIDAIRKAELKVARLESILEETNSELNSKSIYLKEREKLTEGMTSEIDKLRSILSTIKETSTHTAIDKVKLCIVKVAFNIRTDKMMVDDSSHANERLNGLENEVRLLWATSRKNNFELHTLESKSQDAETRLKRTTSRVETMAAIVTEQWIQIQHLERALEIAERRTKDAKRQVSSTKCSFLKFLKFQFGTFIDDWWEMLERIWSAAKQHHHQLQRFVRKEMQKWKYTASIANKEVVFFVASALITFPALTLGLFLLNNLS